jgi:Rrf2 family protein
MKANGSSNLFHVSEAANLALHAMALLAGTGERLIRTQDIAHRLKASTHHLAKVMAALERAGLVQGVRGPSGGYRLARVAERVALKEIFEAIEGPVRVGKCMFGMPVCGGRDCILGGFFKDVNQQVADKLTGTRLSEIVLKMGVRHG